MVKKTAIGAIGLLISLVALYTILNVLYNNNSRPAAALVDLIESRARNYESSALYGAFDYDRERSLLNDYIRRYNDLNNWFIRPGVMERYDEAVVEAERALAEAHRLQEVSAERPTEGEATTGGAMG